MPNRSIGGCLAALAAGFLAGQLFERVINDKPSTDSRTREPYGPPSQPTLPAKAAPQNQHPTEAEHRAAEQLYWRKSIRATWIAVGIATVAAGFSYKAFEEAQRQADAAEDANRPWLYVEGAFLNLTQTKDSQLVLYYSLKIKNAGHDVAGRLYADVNQPMSPKEDVAHFRDRAKFLCEKSIFPDEYLGITAFPGIDTFFPVAKVIKLPSIKTKDEFYQTRLNGCLLYEDGRHRPHRTSFSFMIPSFNLRDPLIGPDNKITALTPFKLTDEPTYAN